MSQAQNKAFDAVVQTIAQESTRTFAAWNDELFQLCGANFRHYFRWQFKDDPEQMLVWRAFMQLMAQAIGAGYLRGTAETEVYQHLGEQNLLGWCLTRMAPRKLAEQPAGQRLAALTKLWNLCEGLLEEPEWVQRYVLSRAQEIEDFGDVELVLFDALESAYAPATPASWTGALHVSCLDAREALEGFLPGEMYLAAPRVLVVADRRDPESHTAVFLDRGACRLMGPTSRLAQQETSARVPTVQLNPRRLQLGERAVDLPQIARPYTHAISPGGFVIVSALDSQRLWVIESA